MSIEISQKIKLFAHPLRLEILRRLSSGECCVDVLTQLTQVPQPNISQHLKLLLEAGLVAVERKGRKRCYRIDDPMVNKLLSIIKDE